MKDDDLERLGEVDTDRDDDLDVLVCSSGGFRPDGFGVARCCDLVVDADVALGPVGRRGGRRLRRVRASAQVRVNTRVGDG